MASAVADDHDFEYVEGFAQSIIAVHHAWNTLNGKVVDLTWRRTKAGRVSDHGQQFNAGAIFPENAYMGITVPRSLLWASQLRSGRYQGALNDIVDIQAVAKVAGADILVMSGGEG